MSESVSEELRQHQSQQVQQQGSHNEPRYSLRDTFKVPSRYRDINRDEVNDQNASYGYIRDRRFFLNFKLSYLFCSMIN